MKNGSGMHRVAENISQLEREYGLNSAVQDSFLEGDQEWAMDADIQVLHTHIPDKVFRGTKGKIVYIIHGTPEHIFSSAVEGGLNHGYGASDPFMMALYWIKKADVIVTFWERHRDIWKTLMDKRALVEYVPLGVDTTFWKPVESLGKYAGTPSLFTAENPHYLKWPLDLAITVPWISEKMPDVRFHFAYVARDQHRWWFPLLTHNGCSYVSYIAGEKFSPEKLRNAFVSTDFYVSTVRYGDYNNICLEAKASGAKVISFEGNEFADYWIPEGDQRKMSARIYSILKGEEPRVTKPVPSLQEMAKGLLEVYGKVAV